jgi:hypothetical protein
MTASDAGLVHAGGMAPARLSKTRYLAGLQCPKRLWLLAHAPALASPPDAADEARLAAGVRVGRRAHALFAGGVEVEQGARRGAAALAETRALVADPTVPAIFEAAFEHGGVRVHVDVLERLGHGAFGLREVKSSTQVKPEHLDDVAVQRWVLEGAGLAIGSAELVHLNCEYVRGPEGLDPGRLFRRVELGPALAPATARVPQEVSRLHEVLARDEAPAVEPGPQCDRPFHCEFWEHCTADEPEDWIHRLPRPGERLERLRALGIERISEIPEDFPLTALQARIREAHRSGEVSVSPDLAVVLEPLIPPALYLDFEALLPAEPLYTGTRPYQAIPFQWSLHRLDAEGRIWHRDFLADGREDPRLAVATSLLETAGDGDEPVLVWSGFEDRILRELSQAFPSLAIPLGELRARLCDLCAITRGQVYHPAFRGSFSIKDVAPALVPGFGWDDLPRDTGIADGAAAAAAFERIARGEETAADERRVRSALRAYCARDTEAILAVHRALRRL